MQVQAYLTFNGRCEEAIEFYKKAIGAKIEAMMRFKDAPADHRCSPGTENNIMHSCLRIGDTAVMASDGMAQGNPEFKGFSLTISAKNEAEADRLFAALAEGGQVHMPLGKTFFSPRFGVLADKFGVGWMVVVEQPAQKAAARAAKA
jgi:PhnB protein